jgi:hypothetical protein
VPTTNPLNLGQADNELKCFWNQASDFTEKSGENAEQELTRLSGGTYNLGERGVSRKNKRLLPVRNTTP